MMMAATKKAGKTNNNLYYTINPKTLSLSHITSSPIYFALN